jgi:hypothetical protein
MRNKDQHVVSHGNSFIHNRQGQIRERDSYGNDPYPPKG